MTLDTHCVVCLNPITGKYVIATLEHEGTEFTVKACSECADTSTRAKYYALMYKPAENISKLLARAELRQ